MTLQKLASTSDDMFSIGKHLGTYLQPHTIITLEGPLGAGKTVLVKGIAESLDINEPIVSPTFTLVQHYENARIPLYHLDLYRLGVSEEFDLIDGRNILSSQSVVCIEWPSLIEEYLSSMPIIKIKISINDDKSRSVIIEGDGIC